MSNVDDFWKNFTDRAASYRSEADRMADLDRRLNEDMRCRIYAAASATQTADDILRRYKSDTEFKAQFKTKLQSKLSKMNQENANQFTQRVIEDVFHQHDPKSNSCSRRQPNDEIDEVIYGIHSPSRSHEACKLFNRFIDKTVPCNNKQIFKTTLVQCAVKHQVVEAKKELKNSAVSTFTIPGSLAISGIAIAVIGGVAGSVTFGLALAAASIALVAVFSAIQLGCYLSKRNKIQKPLKALAQSTPESSTSLTFTSTANHHVQPKEPTGQAPMSA